MPTDKVHCCRFFAREVSEETDRLRFKEVSICRSADLTEIGLQQVRVPLPDRELDRENHDIFCFAVREPDWVEESELQELETKENGIEIADFQYAAPDRDKGSEGSLLKPDRQLYLSLGETGENEVSSMELAKR